MHSSFPYLTVLILLPAGAALASVLIPRHMEPRARNAAIWTCGMGGSLATLVLAAVVAVKFDVHNPGYQMVTRHLWVSGLGISWHLGVDGISLFLVLMSAVLFPIALVAGRTRPNFHMFVAWMLLLEAVCIGAFLSLDLILFFAFFEVSLVPIYFVISSWGFEKSASAAVKFFVYTFFGSIFLFVGIIALAIVHQHDTGVLTFSLPALRSTHMPYYVQVLLFLSFTAAFAVKAPVFPFHTWSPDAYAEAPVGGAVVLAGVMAKLGTYGIIRFDLNLFPRASVNLAPLLLSLGVAGILYGAVVACTQRDMKRMVAYSSLSHIGFVVLGLFALVGAGLSGGVLQMVNHGLIVAALFIAIGWIYERRRTWNVAGLGGLQKPAPVLAAVFTIAMLAAIGLPGLNGFVGEFLVLLGTFIAHRWWAVVATAGVVLAALYMLWTYQQAFHGPVDKEVEETTRDVTWRELLVMAPLVILIGFIGIYPKPLLDRINPSVNQLVSQVDKAAGLRAPALPARRAARVSGAVPRRPGTGKSVAARQRAGVSGAASAPGKLVVSRPLRPGGGGLGVAGGQGRSR